MKLFMLYSVGIVLLAWASTIGNSNQEQDASLQLSQVVGDFWDWRLENSPEYGTRYGINNHDDQLEEYTEAAFQQQKDGTEIFLQRAAAIKEASLSLQDKLSLAILKANLNNFIDGYEFRRFSMYNAINEFSDYKRIISWTKFETVKHYDDYLARLQLIPSRLEQKQKLMLEAIEERTTQPSEAMTGNIETLEAELSLSTENSSFYTPFTNFPENMSTEVKSIFLTEAKNVIETKLIPAWQTYVAFMKNVYIPNVRPHIGASSMPGGDRYYQACLNWHLSLEMSPYQIHQLGLQEVHRISQTMSKMFKDENFNGTLMEYLIHLADDPNNYYNTSAELLQGFRSIIQDANSKLKRILNTVPARELKVIGYDNPYGGIGGYSDPPLDNSRPGIFYANVYDPKQKPKYNMYALTLHEAEPGHHTQSVFAIENNLPNFRRAIEFRKYGAVPFNWLFHTAYSEGWALYAEALGEEMGAYDAPHALFGRYASEIHRAARLVVDTGIHAFNWSVNDASDYLHNYTTLSENTIRNEVIRYITYPGQACAYKIGELKIQELRNKCEQRLGSAFDAKAFNNEVLVLGSAPLHVLEDHINAWLEDTKGTPSVAIQLSSETLCVTLAMLLYWYMQSSN